MPKDDYEEQMKAYRADSRQACKYGSECYQKNADHHNKYKHPPKKQQNNPEKQEPNSKGKKRTSSDREDDATDSSDKPPTKVRKDVDASKEADAHSLSPSPSSKAVEDSESEDEDDDSESSSEESSSPVKDAKTSVGEVSAKTPEIVATEETKENEKEEVEAEESEGDDEPSTNPKKIISDLFLVKMPDDFYKFYEFCTRLSSKDPCNALKLAELKLVGPYDVLNGNIKTNRHEEKEKFLRHWRYYYDPPEFQTILKGNDKNGLHYGYWRDSAKDLPIFVAKNSANDDCKITKVAPNIFGAVAFHLESKLKKASPFESLPMDRLLKQLKAYAKETGVSLTNDNSQMREREKKVVTKTFHTAGIVVPYDKKTQLGYRDLAATDSQLKKILKKIDEAESDVERKESFSKIEEIVRLATIAADECDFGTCLELGHDIFSSGVERVQRTGLTMLAMAYNLLKRDEFAKIAQSHAKDRKKGSDLSVL